MIRMTKELVDSFRKGGLKYRLQRDEDGLWSVRTDKQVFSGTEAGAVEFLKSKGIEAVSEPIKVVLGKTETSVPVAELEVTIEAEVEVEAITEPEPELEVVAVLEQVLEDATDVIDEKEAEIAALKAQIAELEK